MAGAPDRLDHPSFGPCELVPALVAVKWARPVDGEAAASMLGRFALAASPELTSADADKGAPRREPRPVRANISETLTWASGEGGKRLTDANLRKLGGDDAIEWVGPVYRAANAEGGEQSSFAINPTVLLLTAGAANALGEIGAIDPGVEIDQARTRLLKGMVVLRLPAANAIEVAYRLYEMLGSSDGVLFENIPYISPLCGCSCAGSGSPGNALATCAPAAQPLVPNDTFFPSQWGLQRINAPRAWPISQGDPNVVIAVLDQGVDLAHPDLNLWPISYSTVTHTNNGGPVGNHGTACAGIIGAKTDNSTGVSGLAGKCRVMAIATNFADVEVAEGLYFAADNGARVVSMSFGVYPSWMVWNFAIIQAALQYCQDKNVVLVAASGNENLNVSRFPGSDPRTICVGGSNKADLRKSVGDTSSESWWGACYGPDLDVVAPCLEIPTTDRLGAAGYTPNDYDMVFNGTSSATPHVAGVAGLIISVDPALTNVDVRRVISQTTDQINPAGYPYLPTGGKPYGGWNTEVGYGRINAERALLAACASHREEQECGPCGVRVPAPEGCCVSPCDPPWLSDQQCMVWYEQRLFQAPLGDIRKAANVDFAAFRLAIEFRITYEHRMCLLGKQHGPLLFTVTLLPGEEVTLYHSDRYRRVTAEQDRFSVQTTLMQFLSTVHQSHVTGTTDQLNDRLESGSSSKGGSVSGGFFSGLFGISGSVSGGSSGSFTDHIMMRVTSVSDQFNQSVTQASQLTQAERSTVVSTYEEKDITDITSRKLRNDNACRAVTYFVRKVVELYAVSTRVSAISYRVIAPSVPPEWHRIDDLGWLPQQIQDQVRATAAILPKVGEVVEQPAPISLPTDGTVYDPELAHCCSCEPERVAAIDLQLQIQKAQAMKVCLEAQAMEIELDRRRALLQRGELAGFEALPAAEPVPVA